MHKSLQTWRPRYLRIKVSMGLGSIWQEDKDQITKDLNLNDIEPKLETNQVSILKRILDQRVSYFYCNSL